MSSYGGPPGQGPPPNPGGADNNTNNPPPVASGPPTSAFSGAGAPGALPPPGPTLAGQGFNFPPPAPLVETPTAATPQAVPQQQPLNQQPAALPAQGSGWVPLAAPVQAPLPQGGVYPPQQQQLPPTQLPPPTLAAPPLSLSRQASFDRQQQPQQVRPLQPLPLPTQQLPLPLPTQQQQSVLPTQQQQQSMPPPQQQVAQMPPPLPLPTQQQAMLPPQQQQALPPTTQQQAMLPPQQPQMMPLPLPIQQQQQPVAPPPSQQQPPAPVSAPLPEFEQPGSGGPVLQASVPSTPDRSRDAPPQPSRQPSLPGDGYGYRIQGTLERVDESSPEYKQQQGNEGGSAPVAGTGGAPRRRWGEEGGDVNAAGGRRGGGNREPYYSDDSGSDDGRYRRPDQGRRGGGGRRRGEPDTGGKGQRRRSYDSGEYTPDFTDDDGTPRRTPGRNKYTGDVSAWGKRNVPDFYDDKTEPSESNFTMSSGLSPRDTRPREREFDIEAAKKTLMYNAGLYGRAQALRKEGTAPAALGIADDLPNRFAFEQLNALSGMATKVQEAINHNKQLFQQRMWLEDSAILRKCMNAWRAARFGSVQKQTILLRAINRIRRGCLSRAFYAWKDRFHIVDKNLAMRRKVQATIERGLLKRTFLEWRKLEQERWWKVQYAMRDETIHTLERKISGYERRPIMVLKKRRMSKVLNAWFIQAEARRHRRQRAERGLHYFRNSQYTKAWNTWLGLIEERRYYKALMTKVAKRCKNIEMYAAFNKWYELIDIKREKEQHKSKALRFWVNHTKAIAWRTWIGFVDWRREKKKIISRWMAPLQAKAFSGWYMNVQERKRLRLTSMRVMRRMLHATLAKAFFTWLNEVEERKLNEQMSTKEELALKVRDMQEENERLRRDNERFVRLIDSGEWGRGRVSELVSAGEILKGERDALLKLIQSMRSEYESVQTAKGTQEDEMRALKDRMLLGGAARNRMLVKGGSAFNGLVRAMKQDLVEGGAGAAATHKDPNALYEIDKLSMDKVTVFPDGELNVNAVASVPGTAALHRTVSAGRALPGPSTTLGPNMVASPPPHFRGGQPGGPMGRERPMSPTPHRPPSRAHLGEGAAGRPSAAGMPMRDQQRVLSTLQSLTPAEVERLEATIRASAPHLSQQRGGQPRASSARPY